MSEHTPGPWRMGKEVDSESHLVYIPIFGKGKRLSLAGVYGEKDDGTPSTNRHLSPEETRANTCLIAAAPDLLEEGRKIVNPRVFGTEDHGGEEYAVIKVSMTDWEAFRAAIAKAEGKERPITLPRTR